MNEDESWIHWGPQTRGPLKEDAQHLKTVVISEGSWLSALTSFPQLGPRLTCPWSFCILLPHHPGLWASLQQEGYVGLSNRYAFGKRKKWQLVMPLLPKNSASTTGIRIKALKRMARGKKKMARRNLKVFGRTVKLSISNYALYGT